MTSSLAKHLVFKKPYGMTKNMMPTSTEQNWFFLCRENSGVHLADRGSQYLQCPVLQNGKKLFRCLSHVGHADFFDRFENFLYQSTCCLCYNLFYGDAPHFRVCYGLNKFYHERRVPAIFICRSAPLGGGDPACRRPGARYFSQNYFTLTKPSPKALGKQHFPPR